jgi:small subunit ribosomal protein S16
MARGGRKKRPFYRIVVADKRMPRDGRYIEKLGTYNPLLANDDEKRVTLNEERIKYWLDQGAKPSYRVQIFLGKAGIMELPAVPNNPKKSAPSEKTLEKIKDKEEKAANAAAAAEEAPAEEAAAEEAPAEEAAAEEAPAEEAAAEEAPAEEAAAEEAPAEEAAAEEAPAEEEKKEG